MAISAPGKYNLTSCFLIETLATFFFLYVIIDTTSKGAAVGFCRDTHWALPDAYPLFLFPVTNASVNPARAALFRRYLPAEPTSLNSGCFDLRSSLAQ